MLGWRPTLENGIFILLPPSKSLDLEKDALHRDLEWSVC